MLSNITAICIAFLAAAVPLNAQSKTGKVKKDPHAPLAAKGDLPPGSNIRLPAGLVRIRVRDALTRRYLFSSENLSLFEPRVIRVTRDSLSFEYDQVSANKRETWQPKLIFKQLNYMICQDGRVFGRSDLYWLSHLSKEHWGAWSSAGNTAWAFAWNNADDAWQFTEGLNRLIYDAYRSDLGADEMVTFAVTAKTWREKPENRRKPPEEWDRYRILAEQAVKDKDFVKALKNYEAGLAAFPMWPEGWFNAALLYAELEEYEYAANRMKHYLALMPDAPDAKAAREKIIIWEDKAKTKEKK